MPGRKLSIDERLPKNDSSIRGAGKIRFPKKTGMISQVMKGALGGPSSVYGDIPTPSRVKGMVIGVVEPSSSKNEADISYDKNSPGYKKYSYYVRVREWDVGVISPPSKEYTSDQIKELSVNSTDYIAIEAHTLFSTVRDDVPPANAGDIVWVGYESPSTRSGPVYYGPVDFRPMNSGPPAGDNRTAKSTMEQANRGGTSLTATSAPEGDSVGKPTNAPASSNCSDKGWFISPIPLSEVAPATQRRAGQIPDKIVRNSVQDINEGEYLSQFYPELARQIQDYQNGVVDARTPYPVYGPATNPYIKPITDTPRYGWGSRSGISETQVMNPENEIRADVGEDLAKAKTALNSLGAVMSIAKTGEEIRLASVNRDRGTVVPGYKYLKTTVDLNFDNSSLSRSQPGYFQFEYLLTRDKRPQEGYFSKNRRGKFYFNVWALSNKPPGLEYTDPVTGQIFRVERRELNVLVCRDGDERQPAKTEKYTANVVNLTKIMRAYGFNRVTPKKPWLDHCNPRKVEKYQNREYKEISPQWHHFYNKRKYIELDEILENAWDKASDTVEEQVRKWIRKFF
jgi:hypothetical protein